MAAVYSAVDTMSNQITLFTTLQGITLQLLILRLIKILSAQQHLSILTKTTIKVALGVGVTVTFGCEYAMLALGLLVAVDECGLQVVMKYNACV